MARPYTNAKTVLDFIFVINVLLQEKMIGNPTLQQAIKNTIPS
jgi:hypothetical protein